MQLIRAITLDINPKAKIQTIDVKQCDAEADVFTITFTNSITGETVNVSTGQTVKFRCIKPSGFACIYNCTVNENGTATLTLSAETTAENGLTLADVSIEENDQILSTASFWLNVKRSGLSNNIGGSNEYVELVETVAEAQSLIEALAGGGLTFSDDGDGNITVEVVDPDE